jgi:hypothetical protein
MLNGLYPLSQITNGFGNYSIPMSSEACIKIFKVSWVKKIAKWNKVSGKLMVLKLYDGHL